MGWIYKEGARLFEPTERAKKKKPSSQGNSLTTSSPKREDLDMPATNHQQPWRYGQKVKH